MSVSLAYGRNSVLRDWYRVREYRITISAVPVVPRDAKVLTAPGVVLVSR